VEEKRDNHFALRIDISHIGNLRLLVRAAWKYGEPTVQVLYHRQLDPIGSGLYLR